MLLCVHRNAATRYKSFIAAFNLFYFILFYFILHVLTALASICVASVDVYAILFVSHVRSIVCFTLYCIAVLYPDLSDLPFKKICMSMSLCLSVSLSFSLSVAILYSVLLANFCTYWGDQLR